MVTIAAWQFAKGQVDDRIEQRFIAYRDQTLALIADRMKKYEVALWAGAGAAESHGGDMSRGSWHDFAATLRIEEKYPGVNGIGIIHYHTRDTLDGYLDLHRLDRPGFHVFPEHDQPYFMPITYIEPENVNANAIGLDVAHELNRRTAALASRDAGTAQITGPIVLVQDETSTPGFLFYVPFYSGEMPMTLQGRRQQFTGAVYAPFVVHQLMDGLLAKDLRSIRFSIQDGDAFIYDEHLETDSLYDPNPMFSDRVSIDLYGRTWDLDVRTNLAFRQDNTYAQPTFILVAGLVIEGLIILCLFVMSRAHGRAVAYAKRLTAVLRTESAKLAETNIDLSNTNEELEQFSYVVSHDLKTPIRGIGGLTEMIEEDLDDYFASANANPDVRNNLSRIHERVGRMSRLTNSIMEYSQIGKSTQESEPLFLQDAIEGMRLDFGLAPEQLVLADEIGCYYVDTANFRRVLENLVGNAIKYHDGVHPLLIEVNTHKSGDTSQISVKDNGPGIDPEFHQRIFDVFQTLRTGGAPESTGIGLSIVKKAIERHGGKIDVKSTVGNGSIFNFQWPIQMAQDTLENPNKAA